MPNSSVFSVPNRGMVSLGAGRHPAGDNVGERVGRRGVAGGGEILGGMSSGGAVHRRVEEARSWRRAGLWSSPAGFSIGGDTGVGCAGAGGVVRWGFTTARASGAMRPRLGAAPMEVWGRWAVAVDDGKEGDGRREGWSTMEVVPMAMGRPAVGPGVRGTATEGVESRTVGDWEWGRRWWVGDGGAFRASAVLGKAGETDGFGEDGVAVVAGLVRGEMGKPMVGKIVDGRWGRQE